MNLFGVLDPVEQPAKFKKFESKQTAMNSSLHEELRALASNLLTVLLKKNVGSGPDILLVYPIR